MEMERLAENLTGESKAYGYTLTIWGGGSLTIAQYHTPAALEIFLYVGGALAAFATLAPVALLFAYALRLATVVRETVAFGPFVLREERRRDRDWNT